MKICQSAIDFQTHVKWLHCYFNQLLDEVFVISGIIKVEVSDNTYRDLDYSGVYFQTLKNVQMSDKQIFTVFIKEIMHCTRNLQIIN